MLSNSSFLSGGTVLHGGGADIHERGIVYGLNSLPEKSDGYIISGNGSGEFEAILTGLSPDEGYYYRAYVQNDGGISYGPQKYVYLNSYYGTSVTDIDGNMYQTVIIGDQEWMKKNLQVTTYNDGNLIENVTVSQEWRDNVNGAYCYYDNDSANYAADYGCLYNWYAIEDGNLCPSGWHVPTDEEWKQLEIYLGMSRAQADSTGNRGNDEGAQIKEVGTTYWEDPFGTNASGFSARGGSLRNYYGNFGIFLEPDILGILWSGYWWTSTQEDTESAWFRSTDAESTKILREYKDKRWGMSVRCLKD